MSLLSGERMTICLRYRTLKFRALKWVLRRLRAVDYRSIQREKRRIGIQNDISLTIKPSSIIIEAYGSLAAAAAVIISLAAAAAVPRFRPLAALLGAAAPFLPPGPIAGAGLG
jgi:hypothetical protein